MISEILINKEIYFAVLFFISVFIGYVVCHFIIVPILMAKHGKTGVYQAIVWEALQAENHLHDLAKKTNDQAVFTTLKVIKYCKYSMAFFFILFIVSAFLSN